MVKYIIWIIILKMDRFSRMSIKSKHKKPTLAPHKISNNHTTFNKHTPAPVPNKYKLYSTNIRAWSISIPYYWNNLPLVIRSTVDTSYFDE